MNAKAWPALPLIGGLLLSACASTPGGLEQPENASAFQVAQPYQLTLKRIVDADRECMPVQLLPIGQVIDDVQHYPDLREAKIVKGARGIGTQIYQVIAIHEVGEGQTEVTLYAKGRSGPMLARLQRWAQGDPNCDL